MDIVEIGVKTLSKEISIQITGTYESMQHKSHGKESAKVQITQNKGKESENSYQKLKRSQWNRHTYTHGNLIEIKFPCVHVCLSHCDLFNFW